MQLESLPGSVLDQKYSIERRLGEGAMGAVFLATHLGTMRPVAVKVIVPQLAGTREFGQRFKREAEAAGRLIHPNVVNVTDFGVTRVEDRELAYLVMEYLDGQPLSDYLKDHPRPAFSFLLDVMDQTGLALDASHAAGIVHRDLKPNNIWLEPNRRGGYNVKVLDFGIAKVKNPAKHEPAAAADAVATQVMAPPEVAAETIFFAEAGNPLATPSNLRTIAGTSLGTPAYMAPEQCANLEVDARADVYSLAVIAYEMLCGQLPFRAETLADLMRQQIQSRPPSPREHDRTAPEALSEVVMGGLEKDPAARPPTAGTFAARLRAASEGELSLIRRSKDVFHSQTSLFLPVQMACLAATVALVIPLVFAAGWAAKSKLAPEGALIAALGCCFLLLLLFEFQLFKAACAFALKYASEKGQFPPVRAPLKALIAGLGKLVHTQLLSAIDLRPSSFWANGLWPVVWAIEGASGKAAIARSRQLCVALPTASRNLTARHYGPAMSGTLLLSSVLALTDSTGGALHFLWKEILSGSTIAWVTLAYPAIFGIMYLNYGPAYSFLYWSALRCRNEMSDAELPASARDSRQSKPRRIRPAIVLWIGLPAIMLALIVWRANVSGSAQAFEDALSDGRRTAVLKMIDGGLGVDHLTSDRETPLFQAVRGGDEKLVAELLKRGANVNVQSRAGTPLLLAAARGRNELARVLLDQGASVDASDREGRTPLILAAMRGNTALARVLLERGASVARKDTYGKSAAEYASDEGYEELSRLLEGNTK